MNARDAAMDALGRGEAACVVEVSSTRGSVPREVGTRMLVLASAVHGTIGGGHLEWQAIALAREALARHAARPQAWAAFERHYPLGPALGQCCGGAVTLRFAPLDAAGLAAWPEPLRPHHVVLYGAGHVGRAIARLLADLPFTVDWVDERDGEFDLMRWPDGHWPTHVRRIAVDTPEGEAQTAPPGALHLVLTHQHDLDLRICETLLRRGDFAWLGLIGSATKKARFLHRFEARGLPPEHIARLTCPIGVPGIHGKQPEVIAVAVVAQLLQACEHARR